MMSTTFEGSVLTIDGSPYRLSQPIRAIIDIGIAVLVLFDLSSHTFKYGQARNLIAVRRDGTALWTAPLPTTLTGDHYYSLKRVGDRIFADSVQSLVVELDPETGQIIGTEFVK